jgi:carbonic anhydrase/acetyltransferase-like protein (isoleucine patch superfamily)
MDRIGRRNRRCVSRPLSAEHLEDRRLLSAANMVSALELNPVALPAVHPNTPVMAFATPTKKASFIDPTVTIHNGNSVVLSFQSYVAPYATLDARGGGAIKIGDSSDVLDSARLVANPGHAYRTPLLLVGNNVSIGPGAEILGPSVIGSYSDSAADTGIGARAVIDDATIEPGAIVSPMARVGPGVTVPSGFKVLPGMDVTTDAEASNPKLGMVVAVASSDISTLKLTITDAVGLAAGYTSLYQGNSATGANSGGNPAIGGIYNGYLPNIEGASLAPGPSYVGGTKKVAPAFLTQKGFVIGSQLFNFPARVIGPAIFDQRAWQVALHLGRANSIRADEGQPITIGSIQQTGLHVSISSPLGGTLAIGQDFRAGNDAVILGGPGVNSVIGDHVRIGSGAVVTTTSIGSGSTVGANAYLLNSTFPPNTVIPAGAIYVSNKLQGYVES